MNIRVVLGLCACAGCVFPASAGTDLRSYDFAPITALAQQIVLGQAVATPVRGFELLIMHEGRVVYQRSFGLWSNNRVAAADSATKTLSGALIMSLDDASPVPFSLDTRLSDFIPQFDGEAQSITIRQCFAHMSGYGQSGAESNTSVSLQGAALIIASAPLPNGPPGSTFAYGGTSMHAAGAVAELAGQTPWNTLFAQRITGPLGMVNTRFVLTTPTNPRIAGGCESNAVEFGRFMEMLRVGGVYQSSGGPVRILSEAAVQQMFTRQTPVGVPIATSPIQSPVNTDRADYGVGVWLDQRDANGSLVGAVAAGARGFSAWIDFVDASVGVISTDQTLSANLQPGMNQMRAVIEGVLRGSQPCRVDFNGSGSVGVQDVYDYLAAWSAGVTSADFNGVGGVSVQDIYDFLEVWSRGCA